MIDRTRRHFAVTFFAATALALAAARLASTAVAAEPAEAARAAAPQIKPFDAVRALAGTWVATTSEPGKPPTTIVFKPTAGASAVVETMAPGTEMEMTNVYAREDDGGAVTMTHYCHMGNQPRLRCTAIKDGVLKFEFVDGGNIKSRDDAHMDSLEITVKGDRLTENWAMYKDGKVTGNHTFEFKRQ
jgi:hypothetical protein